MATWSKGEDPGIRFEKTDPDIGLLRFGKKEYRPKKSLPRIPIESIDVASTMDNYDVYPDQEYDWARQAERLNFKAQKARQQAAIQRAANNQIRLANSKIVLPDITLNAGGGRLNSRTPRFQRFVQAIAGQESGGNYQAVNPDSGAAGKYQIMPSNFVGLGGWDQETIGRDVNLHYFLNHPKVQERIARGKLRDYFEQYGPRGAASAWYSGDPNKWRDTSSQGAYPTIREYVREIMERMRNG